MLFWLRDWWSTSKSRSHSAFLEASGRAQVWHFAVQVFRTASGTWPSAVGVKQSLLGDESRVGHKWRWRPAVAVIGLAWAWQIVTRT